MNIFYLHENPIQNAKYHIDKHIVKMATEYCQLLSTANRVLDGEMYLGKTKNNRNIKRWRLSDEREDLLMKASHINHPSNIWVRESSANYFEMYKIYMATLAEYTYRYGKTHGAGRASMILQRAPNNIPNKGLTTFAQCMPDDYKVEGDPIQAYKNYYINEKAYFAKWTKRSVPKWWKDDSDAKKKRGLLGLHAKKMA